MKNSQKSVQTRRQNILKLIQEKGELTVEDIAEIFGVSTMTVRRDLQFMEERKMIYRVHGGAVALDKMSDVKIFNAPSILYRERISKYAAQFISDGDRLFINGSRIALNMLRYVGDRRVFVYTNNGWAVEEKYPPNVTVCLTGGELKNHVMVGDYVMRNLLSVNVDKIFVGCAAVYDDGEFRYDIPTEIGINESMVSRTDHIMYVLADHTKLQKRETRETFYGSSSYDRKIVLVTDDKANPDIVEKLRNRNIEVVIAQD